MFESEIVLAIVIGTWVAYELYGRQGSWSSYIRLASGAALTGYLYWQLKEQPDEFKTTLDLAKQLLTSGRGPASTKEKEKEKEKRNVTGLMKKKVAADQAWKCGNCKATLDATYEVDHKIALYKGGSNEMSNLVALCPQCHRTKTVDERLND